MTLAAFPRSRALFGLVIALFTITPAAVFGDESHVWFSNRTTDGWAFVTEFHIEGCDNVPVVRPVPGAPNPCNPKKYTADYSWCVAPGTSVKRGFPFRVKDVRVEVTLTSHCRQPIVFDKKLTFTQTHAISINHFILQGSSGHYTYTSEHT